MYKSFNIKSVDDIGEKTKLVALYPTLLEHVKYQWLLYRSCKFS